MDRGRLTAGIVSSRMLGGDPPTAEVVCKARDGGTVRNVVRVLPGKEYIACNGLYLPKGLPPPGPAIPHHVWQTHTSQAHMDANPVLRAGQASWRSLPGYSYTFHDNAARDALVREHVPRLYPLYEGLPLEVMKADVWRYVAVYVHGGVYADADTTCVREPRALVDHPSLLVTSPERGGTGYFCQWVFAASPRSPVLLRVIEEMGRRLAAAGRLTGASFAAQPHIIHGLTGPAMFTDAVRGFWAARGMPALDHPYVYSRYPSHLLRVLPVRFHSRTVRHASLGSTTSDGWQAQRDGLVAAAGGVVPPRR
jgi:hypothetical protein